MSIVQKFAAAGQGGSSFANAPERASASSILAKSSRPGTADIEPDAFAARDLALDGACVLTGPVLHDADLR
jgi:hypothetical protein